MSKNLTRKGLALGAIVALASTVIAGSPALAAGEVSLATKVGSAYSLISGETFKLSAFAGATIPASSWGSLKTKVTNNSAIAFTTNFAQAGVDASSAGASLSTATSVVVKATSFDGDLTGPTSGAAEVWLTVAAAAAGNFSVQSWLDSNPNDVIDADEFSSVVRTVTFVKAADVTATTAITAPTEGDTTVTAKVSFVGINNEQIPAANVGAYFTKGDGTSLGGNAGDVLKSNVAWATDSFKYTTGTVDGLVKATAVKVQPLYLLAGDPASTDTIASATTATVATRKAGSIVASVVVGKTALANGNVLSNSTFAIKALVKDNTAGTALALASASTAVTITTSATLSSTKTLAVNGVVYTDKTKLPGTSATYPALVVATNASGEAVVSFTTVGFEANENVDASFVTENLPAANATAVSKDAVYSAYALNGNVATTTDGAAVSVPVAVYDQFGGVPAAGYEVLTTLTSSTGFGSTGETASTSATETKATLVDGKATLSITDNGTGTGINTYAVAVKKLTGNTYSASLADIAAFEIRIQDAASLVPGLVEFNDDVDDVTYNSTTKVWTVDAGVVDLALSTFGAFDERAVLGTNPNNGAYVEVSGSISTLGTATSAAALVAGTKVTFTGAGLQFGAYQDGKEIYATDSISVYTDGNGAFDFWVYSNKTGTQSVTATAGSASAKLNIVFAPAAAGTATAISIVAPASIVPGQFTTIKLLAADKYGNPVNTAVGAGAGTSSVKLSVTGGSGYWAVTPGTETDDAGYVSGVWITSAGDTGNLTVTALYDHDTAANDVTVTKSITIGAAVAAAPKVATIASKNGRVYVTVNSAAGFKAWVKVGFSAKPAFKTTGSAKLVSYYVGAGKRVAVRVYVRGGIVASQGITVN